MNYVPNQSAILFQQGRTNTLGVILPELSEIFFSQAISGIEDAAHQEGYNVIMGQSHDNEQTEKELVEAMMRQRVDGILISLGKNTRDLNTFLNPVNNAPIVFFDRVPQLEDIHSVSCNITNSTMQLISFLVKKGHRVIGMINGPQQLSASKERLDGYINGLIKNRLKYDPQLVVNRDLTKAEVHLAASQLLTGKRRPTAIIAFNDYVALDAVYQARKMKFKIDKDISFASFANLPINDYVTHPPIATVEQFPYQQGNTACKMLIDLLRSPDAAATKNPYIRVVMEASLVVRKP